jgi:hypothetical protein
MHDERKPVEGVGARAIDLARNVALLAVLYFAYAFVRRVTADDFTTAFHNARRLVAFQHAIGLPSEQVLQRPFLYHLTVVKAANTFYMWAHFPGTAFFLAWVWLRHRVHFPIVRASLITLTVAGLVLHLVFPLAPPRMLPSQGYVDTGAVFGPSPYDISASEAANQIAAMPSLHVGWALLVAISVIALSRSRWRYLILVHPFITTGVVVLTANHYWADAIIAGLLVMGSWVFMVKLNQLPLLNLPSARRPHPAPPAPNRCDRRSTDVVDLTADGHLDLDERESVRL